MDLFRTPFAFNKWARVSEWARKIGNKMEFYVIKVQITSCIVFLEKKQFRIRKNHREVLENRSFVIYVKSWFLKSQLLDKHMVFWRCSISSSNGHHENGARNIRGERWKHIHHSCPPCIQGTTALFFSCKSGHLYGFDSRRKNSRSLKLHNWLAPH